ncbi:hypothetical protein HHI36_020159 [Cryptolaemus montrouzieri]|uniref:Uncharacterized protein n=1 Tax=Cryptolaemus montrouzieri TaxID=559131 RepID=A0ABD2NA71_9CUCU
MKEELNVKPIIKKIEMRQLQWFGHLVRMDERKNYEESMLGESPKKIKRMEDQGNSGREKKNLSRKGAMEMGQTLDIRKVV